MFGYISVCIRLREMSWINVVGIHASLLKHGIILSNDFPVFSPSGCWMTITSLLKGKHHLCNRPWSPIEL